MLLQIAGGIFLYIGVLIAWRNKYNDVVADRKSRLWSAALEGGTYIWKFLPALLLMMVAGFLFMMFCPFTALFVAYFGDEEFIIGIFSASVLIVGLLAGDIVRHCNPVRYARVKMIAATFLASGLQIAACLSPLIAFAMAIACVVAHALLTNDRKRKIVDVTHIKSLQGAHNWQNAAAAYAACYALGLADNVIIKGMLSFPGLAHRMQWLGKIGKVAFVNDSKATNADAAEKALLTYDDIYWIIGGVAKAGGIAPLAKYFPKIRHAYLIGAAADEFAQTIGAHVPHTLSGTLEAAVKQAARDAAASANANPVVLLSPACASFDQFKNFEQRGEAFITAMQQLGQGDVA
jgi:hypothetical protein